MIMSSQTKKEKKLRFRPIFTIVLLVIIIILVYNIDERSDKIELIIDQRIEFVNPEEKKFEDTPLAKPKPGGRGLEAEWTGYWPSNYDEMPASEHRDTACPLTRVPISKRKERFPDVIAIGAPKCGTGTLAFFDCHSTIVFRESEPAYFNNPFLWRNGLASYALPFAADNEILIEKTPNYMKGNSTQLRRRARLIKKTVPDVKLLVILCDPARRYISHQKHMLVGYRDTALPLAEAELKLIENVQRDVTKLVDNRFQPDALTFSHKSTISRHDDFLAYGNYFTQLSPFIDEFGIDKIHFVDGTKMSGSGAAALAEASHLEQFLKVKTELKFGMNDEKGFTCLVEPVEFCLSAAKGRKSTIDYKAILELETKVLRQYFKHEMNQLYPHLLPNQNKTAFCNSSSLPPTVRFQWMMDYVCS